MTVYRAFTHFLGAVPKLWQHRSGLLRDFEKRAQRLRALAFAQCLFPDISAKESKRAETL